MPSTSTPTAVMNAVKEQLGKLTNEQQPLLKTVRILNRPAQPYDLFEQFPDLTGFPAAILVPQDIHQENSGLPRYLALDLYLIRQEYLLPEIPRSQLKLLDEVLSVLLPDEQGRLPQFGGGHLEFQYSSPCLFGDEHPGWQIRMEVHYVR